MSKKLVNLASKNPPTTVKRVKVNVLGVTVDDISEKNAIMAIMEMAKDLKRAHFVATVNPEFIMLAKSQKSFAKVLSEADLKLADGVGVVLAKLILGGSEQNRVTGTDLIEKLCERSAIQGLTIGFLGGFSGVAEAAKQRQSLKYPGLKVVVAAAGDSAIGQDLRLRATIFGKKRVDVLFVAYGMGPQEFWISRNKKFLNVGVFIGVGGGIDYISQHKTRSPRFLRQIGLEWFWRLVMEPQRIWRMRVLPVFAFLVFLQFLGQIFGSKPATSADL